METAEQVYENVVVSANANMNKESVELLHLTRAYEDAKFVLDGIAERNTLAKAASAAGQAAVRAEIAGLTALVAKLNQPTLRLAWVLVVHCRHQPNGALLLWHSSYGCVYN